MQQSNLQRILADLGITPVYEYNGRTFYDTKDVFDRHNFARDVKRNVEEDEWVLEKTKYYLSERGVVMFAFKKGVSKVMERFMRILEMPAFPETHGVQRDPGMVVGVAVADPNMIDAKLSGMYDPAYLAATGYQYQTPQNPYMMGMVGGMASYPSAQQANYSHAATQTQQGMTKEQQDAYAAQFEVYQHQLQQQQQQYAQQQAQQAQAQAQAQAQQAQQGQNHALAHQSQGQAQGDRSQQHAQQQQQLYAQQQQQYAMQQQMLQQQQQQQQQQRQHGTDYAVPPAENLKAAAMGGVRDPSHWGHSGWSRDALTSPESSVDEARRAAAAAFSRVY